MLHPYPLAQQGITIRKRPNRDRAFEVKALDVRIAAWLCFAHTPARGVERVVAPIISCRLIDLGDQQHPTDGWLERSDQQPMVAASRQSGDRPRCVPPDPICDQPLTTLAGRQQAAYFPTKINHDSSVDVR